MHKACGIMWTIQRQLFYLSLNAEQEVFVSAFCYLFRELERRDRRGEKWEGSARITWKTRDTRCSNKTDRSLCSSAQEGLNGQSVNFILEISSKTSRVKYFIMQTHKIAFCPYICALVCVMVHSDHALFLYRRAMKELSRIWSVQDECPTKGSPPQVSLSHYYQCYAFTS